MKQPLNFLKKSSSILGSGILAGLLCTQAFASFLPSNIFVFGDSLSDIGSNSQLDHNNGGKRAYYTQPGGQSWVKYLANSLNPKVVMKPYDHVDSSSKNNANDFAEGGATAQGEGIPQPNGSGGNFIPSGLNKQLNEYYYLYPPKRREKNTALYITFIGANDIFKAVADKKQGAELINTIEGGADGEALQERTLVNDYAGGPAHYIVMILPDLGKTPEAIKAHQEKAFTQLTDVYNKQLIASLKVFNIGPLKNVTIFNTKKFLDNVVNNKGAYIDGSNYTFKYVKDSACKDSALTCSNPDNKEGDFNFNDFVFTGPVHPTDKTYHILGLAVAQCVNAITPDNSDPAQCSNPVAVLPKPPKI